MILSIARRVHKQGIKSIIIRFLVLKYTIYDCKKASHRDGEATYNTYISQELVSRTTPAPLQTHTPTRSTKNKKQK